MKSSSETLLRRKQVEARTGLSRSAIYEMIQSGRFPPPVHLTERAVAWPESHIDQWIAERIELSLGKREGEK